MPQEVLNIIFSAIGVVITGLASWGVSVLISWMNTKIKDKKLAQWATSITLIVTDAVQSVFQSFVESLKVNGKFDKEAQKQAKEAALRIIKDQLTPELRDYISENFGDMEKYLGEKIESIIYQLKNK